MYFLQIMNYLSYVSSPAPCIFYRSAKRLGKGMCGQRTVGLTEGTPLDFLEICMFKNTVHVSCPPGLYRSTLTWTYCELTVTVSAIFPLLHPQRICVGFPILNIFVVRLVQISASAFCSSVRTLRFLVSTDIIISSRDVAAE